MLFQMMFTDTSLAIVSSTPLFSAPHHIFNIPVVTVTVTYYSSKKRSKKEFHSEIYKMCSSSISNSHSENAFRKILYKF